MTRMFAAVLPPPEVLEHLEEFLAPRQEATVEGRPLRWTPVAQWHVTLAFMEHVPDRAYDLLVDRLAAAAARRHPVEVTRWLRVLDSYAGPSWVVDEVALVASHLGEGPGGKARHEVVASLPMRS